MNDAQTNLSVLIQLDDLCEEYESLFAQRKSPQIADFLNRVDVEHRGKLLHELVALEVGLLGSTDKNLSADEVFERYDRLLPPGEDRDALRSTVEKAIASTVDTQGVEASPTETALWDGRIRNAEAVFPEIEGFVIESVLGRGGMGVVYKAVQTALNRTVALKMILDQGDASGEHIERFEKEAKAVAELNDPHFVQIYDFGSHAGSPYMTLEFVEGGSLEEYRQGEPQPERLAAETVEILSRAMHTAHAAGLVHRDLKPQNVLMSSNGRPKITDFGLVKRQEQEDSQLTEHGRVMGTASYMAPEQSRGEPDVGAAADIHALGGILYCLLTGRPPFLAATVYDTILQVRSEDPVPPSRLRPGISKDLETICLKCLRKESHKRYGTAVDLADDLRRHLEGRPILARPVGVVERSWRWGKRNPLGATVVGLVVAIALIASVMSWRLLVVNSKLRIETTEKETARANEEIERKNAVAAYATKREHYHEVLAAYHRVLYNVDNYLRNNSQDVKTRKRIIEYALQSLEKIQDEDEKNTLFDRTEAIGYQRLGDIYEVVGELKQALAKYDQAYGITASALREEADNPVHIRNLAAICNTQADFLKRLGDNVKAKAKYEEGLALRLQWGDDEDYLPARQAAAFSHGRLGSFNLSLGDAEMAFEHFTSAQELYRDMPRDVQLKLLNDLSTLEHWLGETHYQLGNADEAERYLLRAAGKRAKLYQENKSRSRLDALLRSRLKLGDFYLIQKQDLVKSWSHYKPALAGYQHSWELNPESAETRAGLGDVEYRIGALLRAAKKAGVTLEDVPDGTEPQTHFENSCELREALAKIDPDDMQAKIEWAVALARCGRAGEAEEQAQILAEVGAGNPRLLFQAACTFALCSDSDDDTLADRCRERAFEVLDKLVESGWKDRIVLRDDPDLAPIRDDPRYELLLKSLPAPAALKVEATESNTTDGNTTKSNTTESNTTKSNTTEIGTTENKAPEGKAP